MKHLVILSIAVIITGCTTTSKIDAANTRIQELEKRLARIEGDLYKVEEKSAPRQEKKAEPKFVPAKEVEQSVIDTKINAFLLEYFGVKFGDSIDKYPQTLKGYNSLSEKYRVISVRKKFQYFDKALARFEGGKLYAVSFFADIDEKYSLDSTNTRIDQTRADLAVTLGLASDAFTDKNRGLVRRRRINRGEIPTTSYELSSNLLWHPLHTTGFRRLGVTISDNNLRDRIHAEIEASARVKGEQLPEAK